ncbi:MAG: 3-deoxy-manno-octulosonate cytidylyltransferase [Acidobacteriota bacterium]|nr:3-deoxy-manno-octulosonate cytidylyltransferase [Acidobacteriota bacterium]
MGQHGKNPRQKVIAIIPARLSSTRLPNKLLLPLAGKPLILWTVEQAKKAKNISRVIVATDSEEILRVVQGNCFEAVLTAENHQSGSDRVAEVAGTLEENSIIVNVQGDEPLIQPSTIEKAVEAVLQNDAVDIATTCEKIENLNDVLSPDVVKVVTDKDGFALYFSRLPIPFPREAVKKYGTLENALRQEKDLIAVHRKHTGLYVYRREFLLKYTKLKQTNLEKLEMLEQLRALENGARIKVVEVSETSIGVDTKEDFQRVKALIEKSEKRLNDFSFRRANLNDLPAVAKVYVQTSQKSYQGIVPQPFLNNLPKEKDDFWKEFFKNGYQIFIAENAKGEIVGFVDFEEMPKGIPFDFKVNSLYVLPEYQRKGIGSELFALVVKELNVQGNNSMVLEALEVSPFNSFYENRGGEIVGFSHQQLAGENFKTLVYGWKDLSKL